MDRALIKLQEAIQKNELLNYLMGEKDYAFQDPWAETPTDLATVFLEGFNGFVSIQQTNRETLRHELRKALLQMLNTPVGTWWTISILYTYLYSFNENTLHFQIDIAPLIDNINTRLAQFKSDLIRNKTWVGWRFENGLWDDIRYMAAKINEKTGSDGQLLLSD